MGVLRAIARAAQAAGRTVRTALARLARLSRRALRAGIVLGAIAAASFAVAALGATVYGQFGYHPGGNADAWAARTPRFIGPAACAACHTEQATSWTAGPHAGVTCESCHGPKAGHPEASTSPSEAEEAPLDTSPNAPSTLCLSCHAAVLARPSGFATVDPATHYGPAECTACHEPHLAAAPRPPDVLHSLAGLPECTFCHGPAGMRPLPATHPSWPGDCLTCHRAVEPGVQP
jgi:hypothetical protein